MAKESAMRHKVQAGKSWIPIALCGCAWLFVRVHGLDAQQPSAGTSATVMVSAPETLSREGALRWTLQYNAELAALRQQHGIAAAAIVIAETYPFNPLWESKTRAANGPESAGITNRVATENFVPLELEIRHQGRYRRLGAYAGLTRTDWEIAAQEQAFAIRAVRAFDAVVYRQQKLALLEETVRLNRQTVRQVMDLRTTSKVTAADLIIAQTEESDARAQVGVGQAALVGVRQDLRRLLNLPDQPLEISGTLVVSLVPFDVNTLMQSARDQRADLRARQAALGEADAKVQLEVANRFGNPVLGPSYEYDASRINLVGAQFTIPLPVLNTRRGEIQQREAERARAGLELRQTEILIEHDIRAAVDRITAARRVVETYEKELLPNLQSALKEMQTLLSQASVDVLKVIDVQRKLIAARDRYLDALFELRQAKADLAAAVGDPSLSLEP